MPSYILGFVTTSVFGVAGPIQDVVARPVRTRRLVPGGRVAGRRDRHVRRWPCIRTCTCWPAPRCATRRRVRTSSPARSAPSPAESMRRVVLPLLRPAIAAGAAVVMMETLTDFAHRAVLQRRHRDGRRVPDLAWHLRPRRGQRDRARRARVRRARHRPRTGRSAGGPASASPAARAAASNRRRLTGWQPAWPRRRPRSVVPSPSSHPRCSCVTWAIAEQRSPRGTPMLDQYPEYLWNSLALVAITASCA